MPRAKTVKFYRTFSKGLITEAGYLTYPEDASSDELNTILSRKGNRSRRLGIDYEEDAVLKSVPAEDKEATAEFVWSSVNNDPNMTILCQQIGAKIYFYRMNGEALSTNEMPFSVDLSAFRIPTANIGDFASEYCDFSAGSGFLFVAHRYMDPISVEYEPKTDTIITIPIVIQIRDFEGVYDGLPNDEEPVSLSAQHHYNLLNQGWVTPGTPAVDISTPSYPGATPGTSSGDGAFSGGEELGDTAYEGPVYYDPYTGESRVPHWKFQPLEGDPES